LACGGWPVKTKKLLNKNTDRKNGYNQRIKELCMAAIKTNPQVK